MLLLQKLIGRRPWTGEPKTGTTSWGSTLSGGPTDINPAAAVEQGFHAEYHKLISRQLERWGVAESCATVQVRQIGPSEDGRPVYVGMIRMVAWERDASIRLLLGLPLLDTKVRTKLRGFWWAEVSHFGGLWLHPTETMQSPGTQLELRELISTFTQQPSEHVHTGPDSSGPVSVLRPLTADRSKDGLGST